MVSSFRESESERDTKTVNGEPIASPSASDAIENAPQSAMRSLSSRPARKELAHCSGNFRGMGLQREVSGIKKAHVCTWIVAFERLGTHREEERIVLTPYRQETRLVSAEILLEGWVEHDIALVITEQVELQLIGSRPSQVKV